MAIDGSFTDFPNRLSDAPRTTIDWHAILTPASPPEGGLPILEEYRAAGVDDMILAVESWQAPRFRFEGICGMDVAGEMLQRELQLNHIVGHTGRMRLSRVQHYVYNLRIHSGRATAVWMPFHTSDASYTYHVRFVATCSIPFSWDD